MVTSAGTQEELRRWSGTVDDLSHRVEDEDLEVAGGPRAVDVEAVVLPAHESPQPWLLAGIGLSGANTHPSGADLDLGFRVG